MDWCYLANGGNCCFFRYASVALHCCDLPCMVSILDTAKGVGQCTWFPEAQWESCTSEHLSLKMALGGMGVLKEARPKQLEEWAPCSGPVSFGVACWR